MHLTGLHLLLTYECNFECDHCFVWGGPGQPGTMTIRQIEDILRQAKAAKTIAWIYFEGGEPFLYPAALRHGVRRAWQMGFKVGIVSNAYWATAPEDAFESLRDFAGDVQDLSVSCDRFHGDGEQIRHARTALQAAKALGIPADSIEIEESPEAAAAMGQLPSGESGVMYRGRAAVRLVSQARKHPGSEMTECSNENLREPGRVHVDPFGNVHICQGIVIGNLFRTPLAEICASYDPDTHPITGPLLAGGPAELARRSGVDLQQGYADACHLCYEARVRLRSRFPSELAPDQMYGASKSSDPRE